MIKVMVVEDEPIIGKTLVNMINKYGHDVFVVNYAINGKRALEYLEKESVHIIFSDIKMPIMDGLELMKIIREKYPNIITFITSGFQKFEYARSAMEFKVERYLLKPITEKSLYVCLDFAVKEVEKENLIKENLIIDKALNNKLEKSDKEISSCLLFYISLGNLPYSRDDFLFDNIILENYEKANKIITKIFIDNFKNDEMSLDHKNLSQGYIITKGKTQAEIAIIFDKVSDKKMISLGETVFKQLKKELNVCVNVYINKEPVSLSSVGTNFDKMRKDLGNKIVMFHSNFWESETQILLQKFNTSELNKNFIVALTSKNENKISESCSKILKTFFKNKGSQLTLMLFLKKIAYKYFDNILNEKEMSGLILEIENSISFSISLENLIKEISLSFYTYANFEQNIKSSEEDVLCALVKEYINRNYKSNITSARLGEEFNISPIQLYRRFKNEYSISISEYCNNLRIEIAKNIMINAPDIMIKEVGIEVGYNDQYYFSKIFKKIEGVWPSQFLKDNEKK